MLVKYELLLPSRKPKQLAICRGLSSAVGAMAPNRLGEDISVPRDAFLKLFAVSEI